MRWLATLAAVIVSALIPPTEASSYTFGEWASAQGYSPDDAMPDMVDAGGASIDSLDGIGSFDWQSTPTTTLWLNNNDLSSIESDDFAELTELEVLRLSYNEISSIESGDFNGLTNLRRLRLHNNEILSIEPGDFSGLTNLDWLSVADNRLESIESGDFSGLANLEQLYLGRNQIASIEPDDFSDLTNLTKLSLSKNNLSRIESDDFSGLTNLTSLDLGWSPISSIESGAFSGLTELKVLDLSDNVSLGQLNLDEADFSSLLFLDVGSNVSVTSVSLRNAVVKQASLEVLLDGGSENPLHVGIGELGGITKMNLSGVDFANITDLAPLYVMHELTDVWLVDTLNLDATDLDLLLDNLSTVGILHMTPANFDAFNTAGGGLLAAWNAESGHHVGFLGDVNHDSEINSLDINPFMDMLLAGPFDVAADMNGDGAVNGLDIAPFIAAVQTGGGVQTVPEPATFWLTGIGLLGLLVFGWRRRT